MPARGRRLYEERRGRSGISSLMQPGEPSASLSYSLHMLSALMSCVPVGLVHRTLTTSSTDRLRSPPADAPTLRLLYQDLSPACHAESSMHTCFQLYCLLQFSAWMHDFHQVQAAHLCLLCVPQTRDKRREHRSSALLFDSQTMLLYVFESHPES